MYTYISPCSADSAAIFWEIEPYVFAPPRCRISSRTSGAILNPRSNSTLTNKKPTRGWANT